MKPPEIVTATRSELDAILVLVAPVLPPPQYQLLQGVPSWATRVPIVRSLIFGTVLLHEIGHHIHAVQRPEHREREDVADDWQRRLTLGYLKRRHRLAVLVLRPVLRFVRWVRRLGRASHALR